MAIQKVPDIYIDDEVKSPDVFVYDFKMTSDAVKTKVDLSMHMFSFLQVGRKQVHFADTSVAVNKDWSLLLKKGNCLWTELLETDEIYYCKLLFFSDKQLERYLKKQHIKTVKQLPLKPYFTIENDAYIASFLTSLNAINTSDTSFFSQMLSLKFEELMLYLTNKYGNDFIAFLQFLVAQKSSKFKEVVEKNIYSNLKLEEIAFLCNMSLSSFKRHFINTYKQSPGQWIKNKRLLKAKSLLEKGKKPSDIYLDFGYNNLSNFSVAFKNKFGVNPREFVK